MFWSGAYNKCSKCGALSDDGGVDLLYDDDGNFVGFGLWKCLDCIEKENDEYDRKLVYKDKNIG